MTEEQFKRLRELKSKYYVKYYFIPNLDKLSMSTPFDAKMLVEASLRMSGI